MLTSVHHDHSQTADKGKVKLTPTATPPATPVEPDYSRPGLNYVGIMLNGGRIVFSDESSFELCPDDHRRFVWRLPRQRVPPAFTITLHTGP
ncbi:hypothetical protein TNCV_3421061 [Trichonephila clavipes]|nr:hypothetical protein TNCV_3421061 [Trichonephila clavipes]